jgi:Flp pilus assembly protein TadG
LGSPDVRFRAQRAQALVEFALVSIFLALLLGAVIEFGFLFGHKIELAGGARAGARWAAGHSAAWSAIASPPSNSIEGQVRAAGGLSQLANDDAHITIEYLAVSGSTTTLCGGYSQTTATFTAQAGYSRATCVIAGNLVRVTLKSPYTLVTGLLGGVLGGRVNLSSVATTVMTS